MYPSYYQKVPKRSLILILRFFEEYSLPTFSYYFSWKGKQLLIDDLIYSLTKKNYQNENETLLPEFYLKS